LLLLIGITLALCGYEFDDLQSWLKSKGHWAPLAFVLLGIVSMTMLVPKTLVSITAGALFGTMNGGLLMLFIAVLAAAVNYGIGRWWLFESINRRFDHPSRKSDQSWTRVVRDMAADAGFGFHFLARLLPVPATMISYLMGASGSRLSPFLWAAAFGVIPQLLWVHGGTAFTMIDDPSTTGLRWMGVAVSVLAGIAIAVIVPREAMQRIEAARTADGSLDESAQQV
jgi:uncharacterized membrane protein YdjX (TVP38/TMEM64 family)